MGGSALPGFGSGLAEVPPLLSGDVDGEGVDGLLSLPSGEGLVSFSLG